MAHHPRLTPSAHASFPGISPWTLAAAAVFTSAFASEPASAEGEATGAPQVPPPTVGFAYGLRSGLGIGWGKTDKPAAQPGLRSGNLSDLVMLRVPVWLDLGYQLNSEWWLGIQTQLGLGWTGDDCPTTADCHFTELRLGAQALYSPATQMGGMPWLGVSVGWESLWSSMTRPVSSVALPPDALDGLDTSGLAFTAKELLGGPQVTLQAGLRFPLEESVTVGPYVSTSVGAYVTDSFKCPAGCESDRAVENVQLHGWVGVGLRLTHGP